MISYRLFVFRVRESVVYEYIPTYEALLFFCSTFGPTEALNRAVLETLQQQERRAALHDLFCPATTSISGVEIDASFRLSVADVVLIYSTSPPIRGLLAIHEPPSAPSAVVTAFEKLLDPAAAALPDSLSYNSLKSFQA